jgi:hypothetical protein
VTIGIDQEMVTIGLVVFGRINIVHAGQISPPDDAWVRHALTLVVAAGERFLEAKGWYKLSDENLDGWFPNGKWSVFPKTLPDALRAVMEAKG